jgi:hypothetical protein
MNQRSIIGELKTEVGFSNALAKPPQTRAAILSRHDGPPLAEALLASGRQHRRRKRWRVVVLGWSC